MDPLRSPGETVIPVVSPDFDTASSAFLLEQSLQGAYKDLSVTHYIHLALFHNLAPSRYPHLTSALHAFIQSCTNYTSAQQVLREANIQFSKADAELQANLDHLKIFLSALIENPNVAPPVQPPHAEQETTLPALHF